MRALVAVLALSACTPEIDAYKPLDVQRARDLDILFVLDDSADRAKYDQMVSQLDVLQTRLSQVDGQLPSLHIGVITTDLGTSGTDDVVPGAAIGNCNGYGKAAQLQTFGPGTVGGYLEDTRGPDGNRVRNFASGDLTLELGRLMNPSSVTPGCEFEQPLEAMRRALDKETNPGFIRDGAMLAVVFLTNEDDCSLSHGALLDPANAALGAPGSFRCTKQGIICDPDDLDTEGPHYNCRPRESSPFLVDVAEYKAFLDAYKPNKADIVVSAVAGPRTSFDTRTVFGSPSLAPSCQGPAGSAQPAVRIGALVDAFGGVTVDACTQEAAYQKLTTPIVNRQRSCFPVLAKSELTGCTVMEMANGTETELPQCAEGMTDCWYSYVDAAACPSGDNLGIAVKHTTNTTAAGARVEARCFVQ